MTVTTTNNSNNVRVGAPLATGGAYAGPITAPGPTDTKTALDPAFIGLGLCGADGLKLKTDRSTDDVEDWGGSVVRVIQTKFGTEAEIEFIEVSTAVLKEVFGAGNVAVTPPTTTAGTQHAIKINKETLPRRSYVFEMKDGNARSRVHLPLAQLDKIDDIAFSSKDIVSFKSTIKCFEDANGQMAYWYLDDGTFASI